MHEMQSFHLFSVAALLLCAGCSSMGKKEEMPTTITVWHVYGGQTDSPLNDLIEQFNQTVGKDRQINVQVTSVSNTNTIHELVLGGRQRRAGSSGAARPFRLLPQDCDGVARRQHFGGLSGLFQRRRIIRLPAGFRGRGDRQRPPGRPPRGKIHGDHVYQPDHL